jgi:transposase
MTEQKTFTAAFKLEIAKLMVEDTTAPSKPAKPPGRETAVKRWKRQYLAELAGKPLPNAQALTPEQREIQQLRQRIKQLETEHDILKKASAFFAQQMR